MESARDLHKYLVIVAGGRGARMGSTLPKQFMTIAGRPIIMLSIDRFVSVYPSIEIIVVLGPGLIEQWENLIDKYDFQTPHHIARGGEERFFSVRNGLDFVTQPSLVAVHDAVRPFVTPQIIRRSFDKAATYGTAVPVIHPSESVREIVGGDENRPVDRSVIRLVQTPQVFRSEIILEAYNLKYQPGFTDDASVVEALGQKIRLVDGDPCNIKITTRRDIVVGEGIYASQQETPDRY